MSISSSRSAPGSSSTTTARFFISRRKRTGISSMASATSCSNLFRSTFFGDDMAEVVAVVTHGALAAERLRLADPPAVQDLHVRRERPHLLRQTIAQLLFDLHGVVAFRDADAIRHAQYVAIARQARDAERVAEDDIRRLAADARKGG